MRRAFPYILFAFLIAVFLWKPIFRGDALLPGDYLASMSPWNTVIKVSNPPQWNPLQWDAIAQFYPWRVFYAREMSSGHLPLWNPHQFGGTPFLANGQSAVLYPGNLLFLIFAPITAFTIFAVLHLFLAASFMYMLLRELGAKETGGIVAAIVFTFSAFMILWLELPTFISCAAWLPLVLLLINRSIEHRSKYCAMLAGLALAMSFLAGHFQIAFYVSLAAGIFWLWKMIGIYREEGGLEVLARAIIPFAIFATVAFLIAAPQILPTRELAASSHRVREITESGYQQFISNALHPYRLITAFSPDYYGSPSRNNYYLGSAADYMEYGLYAGILPLMLAMFGLFAIKKNRNIAFFAILALLAILVATGTAINRLFYFGIPGFSALGGPNRILLLYFFALAAMAGFGFDSFIERAQEGRGAKAAVISALAATGIAGILLYISAQLSVGYLDSLGHVEAAMFGKNVLGFLLLSLLIMMIRALRLINKRTFAVLAITFIVADLFAFGINYNPTCVRSHVYPETELTRTLERIAKDSRIAPINSKWSLYETPSAILPPNSAMVYGLYDTQGYDSLFTKSYKDLSSRVQGEDSSPPENGNMVLMRAFTGEKYRSDLGARYIVTRENLSNWTPDNFRADTLEYVGSFDGIRIYDLYAPGYRRLPYAWRWEGPNRVKDRANVSAPGMHLAPCLPIPGWAAVQNSKRLSVTSFNQRLAVKTVAPGKVVFEYAPFSFRFGLYLMCIGIAAICVVGTFKALGSRARR